MKRLLLPLLLALALPAPALAQDTSSSPDLRPLTSDLRPLTPDLRPLTPDLRPLTSDLSSSPLNPEPFILERATAEGAVELPHKGTGERIGEAVAGFLHDDLGLSYDIAIAAISTLPIVELRGAIPVGHMLLPDTDRSTRLGPDDLARSARIFLWAVVGNMIPVPFILLLLGPVSKLCMKVPVGKRFFDWLFARTRHKTASVEKYETLGLTVFVAIPLPVTGAWTGAMAAFLMGLSLPHAMISIFLGVLIAGVIMTTLSLMGWFGAAIAGAVLLALFVTALAKGLKK